MTYKALHDVFLSTPLWPQLLLLLSLYSFHSSHAGLLLPLDPSRRISKLGLLLWLFSVPGIFFPQITSSSPRFCSNFTFTMRPTNLKLRTARLWISSFFLPCSTFSFFHSVYHPLTYCIIYFVKFIAYWPLSAKMLASWGQIFLCVFFFTVLSQGPGIVHLNRHPINIYWNNWINYWIRELLFGTGTQDQSSLSRQILSQASICWAKLHFHYLVFTDGT